MKISLENVAILKKVDIEINGITVAAGLNGTGKTTVGKSVYATLNAYKGLPERVLDARKDSIQKEVLKVSSALVYYDDVSNKLTSYALALYHFVEDSLMKWMEEGESVLKNDIYAWFQKFEFLQNNDIEKICEVLSKVIARPDTEYISFLSESYYKKIFSDQINHFRKKSVGRFKWESSESQLYAEFTEDELSEYKYCSSFEQKAVYIESQNILDVFKSYSAIDKGTYKPTVASRELFHLLGVEAASQETLEEYISAKEIKNIVNVIIDEVTHGTLKMESPQSFSFFDENMDHVVDISNLSAGLKIFVVIQRLLENGSLRRGDVLLIDEPEINLHPEWQVLFAEILVRMWKELGIYIYINTHSPYFIHAIEVKMAEKEITDQGKFYLMERDGNGLCHSVDVTENTEKIYELLYKPLEL